MRMSRKYRIFVKSEKSAIAVYNVESIQGHRSLFPRLLPPVVPPIKSILVGGVKCTLSTWAKYYKKFWAERFIRCLVCKFRNTFK